MSDPTFSDIDFKNEMGLVWTTLKLGKICIPTYILLSGEYYFCTKCKMAAHPLKSKCEEGETPDDTKSLLFLNEMKVRLCRD